MTHRTRRAAKHRHYLYSKAIIVFQYVWLIFRVLTVALLMSPDALSQGAAQEWTREISTPYATSIDLAAELVMISEGWRPKKYNCPAGVRTIGYGHTRASPCSDFDALGDEITREEGEALLKCDLLVAQREVRALVIVPMTRYQEGALIDFVVNFGSGALRDSELLEQLNAGQYQKVPTQLQRWVHARDPRTGKKVVLGGLVTRRQREIALWLQ